MNSHRHRDSILQLFDPLSWPETPPRNTSSPDCSSDKENDNPKPGPVTEFFNRVYKTSECAQLPPGKLIDFGDVSVTLDVADADTHDMEAEEDDAAEEELENSVETGQGDMRDLIALTPARQRAPLAEIKLERTPPTAVHLPPTINEDSERAGSSGTVGSSQEFVVVEGKPVTVAPAVSAAPYGTPLADVINSINLSAFMPLGGAASGEAPTEPCVALTDITDGPPCPNIAVFPPDEEQPAVADDPQPESSSHLSPTSFTRSVSGLRRQGVTTSTDDPRRVSVDLHSSFSLHMQSEEMSFDLLNDKISLFGQPQDSSDSIWTGLQDDDTLDLSRECRALQDAAHKLLKPSQVSIDEDTIDFAKVRRRMEAVTKEYGTIHEESLHVAEAVAAAAVICSPRHMNGGMNGGVATLPPIFSPPTKTSTPKDATTPPSAAAPVLPAPIFTPKPKEKPENKSRLSIRPPPAALKPASLSRSSRQFLKMGCEAADPTKSSSSSGGTSRPGSRASSGRSSSEGGDDAPVAAETSVKVGTRTVHPAKRLERPPAGAAIAPSSSARPATAKLPTGLSQRTRPVSQSVVAPSPAPQPSVLRRPSFVKSASLGKAAASVLQRAAASSAAVPPAERPSGLRAPSRFVSSAMAGQAATALPDRSGSNIPKPASKLPGPSRAFGLTSKPSLFFKKSS